MIQFRLVVTFRPFFFFLFFLVTKQWPLECNFLPYWPFDWLCAEGAANEELEAASSGLVGENDLLIVGPGVLGRLVAEKWREVLITTIPFD
jgi:hypothetical protein